MSVTATTLDMPHATTTPRPTTPRARRFNCFVDDTALIAGLKRSTRDGIKKWVNNGSIQVYVPLHTLERLRYLASQTERPGRVTVDAQEAIEWLDQITSDSENPASQLVHLEAPLQLFDTWSEVEKFMLPETLLSMESEVQVPAEAETEQLIDSLADLRMDALPDNASMSSESNGARTSSPISVYSSTSPAAKAVQPIGHGRPNHKKTGSNVSNTSTEQAFSQKTVVPKSLQPFFNHLLWRINQGLDFNETRDSYILVTNDGLKQQIGQRFGIRVKRLEQLREVIAREERDMRNRDLLLKREGATPVTTPKAGLNINGTDGAHDDDDDDDEILFKRQPPKAPQAMNGGAKQIVDPNAFGGRSSYTPRNSGRGSFRGNRGGSSPALNRTNGPFVPRNVTPTAHRQLGANLDLSQPIDPDSYARPNSAKGLGRGGRRRLWEPT